MCGTRHVGMGRRGEGEAGLLPRPESFRADEQTG